MPSPEDTFRVHQAVYWKAVGYDQHGDVLLDPPIELDVRWDETTSDNKAPDDRSENITVAVIVDRVIPKGSIFWFGKMMHYSSAGTDNDYMEVTAYKEVSDVKGRKKRRSVDTIFHGNTLPTMN